MSAFTGSVHIHGGVCTMIELKIAYQAFQVCVVLLAVSVSMVVYAQIVCRY